MSAKLNEKKLLIASRFREIFSVFYVAYEPYICWKGGKFAITDREWLQACWEIIEKLTDEQWNEVCLTIVRLTCYNQTKHIGRIAHLDTEQYINAIGLTIELWKE